MIFRKNVQSGRSILYLTSAGFELCRRFFMNFKPPIPSKPPQTYPIQQLKYKDWA